MKFAHVLFFAVAGWTALGAIGVGISLARGRRAEALRHTAWVAGVLGLYLVVLLTVSILQPPKSIAAGQDQCFGDMCFAVLRADEVPGLVAGDPSRVVRATIRVSNRGKSADSEGLIRAYLIDGKGEISEPLPGLSGNRLTTLVAGRSEMLSQPMFRVAPDANSLSLVFTHGHWQTGRLTVGDSDSIAHKPTVVPLQPVLLER